MAYMDEYKKWLSRSDLDPDMRRELEAIEGDDKAIEDAFFAPLSFGTAGLRGVMGGGINRMNLYTVAQATKGLSRYILSFGGEAAERGCAIAYDSRNNSPYFAEIAARVLARDGVRVYLFDELRPTPELSFIIRKNRYIAGVNNPASHNPKEYNGYKVYWEDGAQLSNKVADEVSALIGETDLFGVELMDMEEAKKAGLVTILGSGEDELYYRAILKTAINPDAIREAAPGFKVIYTPFHGAGYREVPEILKRLGQVSLYPVKEQMVVDGNFPTVKSPNPENKEGFAIAIEMAKTMDVDLIVGTDPDADRLGAVVRNAEGEYVSLSGNQMGVLLLDYIIKSRREKGTLSDRAVAITSCVSTRMTEAVARAGGVEMDYCFTGFRFIAERMNRARSEGKQFLLGFEESCGYLLGDYARDKDAVGAAAMVVEMAAYYHLRGKTLYDVMTECYEKYGYYSEETMNLVMPGVDGLQKIRALMKTLRETPPDKIAGRAVRTVSDYLKGTKKGSGGEEELPAHLTGSNVLGFALEDGSEVLVRPSGTEPKVKVYLLTRGENMREAEAARGELAEACRGWI
ncbi:MAG: phospho-sugar mutase [Clostridia bacterium]|nr:phospho-sugar mutase [Clostridia bacterium]